MPIFLSVNYELYYISFQKKNSGVGIIQNQDLVFSFFELVSSSEIFNFSSSNSKWNRKSLTIELVT